MIPSWRIRAPYPDELQRVSRILPKTPEQHAIRIAVAGRVERIAAAAVLYIPRGPHPVSMLRFAASISDNSPEILISVLEPLVQEAKAAGSAEVVLVGSFPEEHPLTPLLLRAGFETYRQTEVYRVSATAISRRVEAVYQRMAARQLIPPTARAIPPRGRWLPKLREFLDQQNPTLEERLDTEEGFTLDHSLILLVEDEVRGAFFTRNQGCESYIGLMLLDPALRGGLPWANTLMMREMLQFGEFVGVEHLIGEVHPEEHRGSRLIAQNTGAELICRRWQFRQRFTV